MNAQIRYSAAAEICMTEDENGFHATTQREMDTLPVGADLTEEEIDGLDA